MNCKNNYFLASQYCVRNVEVEQSFFLDTKPTIYHIVSGHFEFK